MAVGFPVDLVPIDPQTGRLKLIWVSFLQSLAGFPLVYTVAGLPASARTGTIAFASNGRKSGESAGHGTGVAVYWDTSGAWYTFYGNTAVAA